MSKTYQNNQGLQVTIVHNADGSFTATDSNGFSRTYGQNVAPNIVHDFDLPETWDQVLADIG